MGGFIIVGGGARGMLFTEILEHDLGAKVVAIVEKLPGGDAYVQHRLDEARIESVAIYPNLELAMDAHPSSSVDGLFIMTPEWTHAEIFRQTTQRGYNIFLEKPVATNAADAREIRDIAAGYPHVIQLGFVLRYSTFYRQVKEWLAGSPLGHITMIQMNERLTIQHGVKFKRSWHRLAEFTGGYINEKCSHDLDLMCWFKEHEATPVRVVSMGNRGFAREGVGETTCTTCSRIDCLYRDDPSSYAKYLDGRVVMDDTASGIGRCIYGNDSDINDNQTVMIEFSDESHGVFSSITMSGIPGRDLTIHCEYGVIWGDLESGVLHRIDYRTNVTEEVHVPGMDGHGGGDTQVVREFLECIHRTATPVAGVAEGVRATLLAFAADASVTAHAVVEVVP